MIDLYTKEITGSVFLELEKLDLNMDLHSLIHNIIKVSIQSHTIAKDAHEEMLAMSHSDKDVGDYFYKFRSKLVKQLVDLMAQHNFHPTHANEKVILAYNIIEDLCHEIVYYKQDSIDYDVMIEEAITMIIYLLNKEDH